MGALTTLRNQRQEDKEKKVKRFALIILLGLLTPAQVNRSYGASFEDGPHVLADSSAQLANQVVQWNRTLLVILRTPGA